MKVVVAATTQCCRRRFVGSNRSSTVVEAASLMTFLKSSDMPLSPDVGQLLVQPHPLAEEVHPALADAL